MMATAMWCERRQQPGNEVAMSSQRGSRINEFNDLYEFLLRYKRTQDKLYESARHRLMDLKKDRVQNEPKRTRTA